MIATGPVWAKCNSVSIGVEGTVDPPVAGAMVRVDVLPTVKQGRDSVVVWPDATGGFAASLWYGTFNGGGLFGSDLFGHDCSRTPQTMIVSLIAGDQTIATARLEIPASFAVDALGNYRVKHGVTLRAAGRSGR